jgi:SAM-dependent methyltransferase
VSDGSSVEDRVLADTAGEADPVFRRRAAWALSRLAARPGDRVLEVGTGLGSLLILLSRVAPVFAVASDIDLGRLLLARSCGFDGPAVVADAARLPFCTGCFDRLLACEVLEHLEDDAAALREARRVVTRNARLALTVPNARYPASWDPLARLLEAIGVQPPRTGFYVGIWHGHRRLYTEERLAALVAATGWTPVEEALIGRGGVPFSHFLLYGVGKRLLSAGLLGAAAGASVGRRRDSGARLPFWHPVTFAVALLRWCDARRGGRAARSRRSVHLGALLVPAKNDADLDPPTPHPVQALSS